MRLLNKALGSIGGLIIGVMMLLTVAEVLSRLFLGSSIEGTIETVGIFLALAVFFGFSPCEEGGNHIRVKLAVRLLPRRIVIFLDMVVYVLAIAIVMVSAWQVGLDALSSWKFMEVLPGANIQVPVYPAKTAAFIGYLAFCLQLIVNLIKIVKHKKRSVFETQLPQ